MAKKHLYYDEAERLYCVEQLTFEEVAKRMPVSERTLRSWGSEGEWDNKRKGYFESRRLFHEELYNLGRLLVQSLNADLAAGNEINPRRINALARIIPNLTKIKEYEEVVKAAQDDEPAGDVDAATEAVEKILGIT
jgi:hypothetical protein